MSDWKGNVKMVLKEVVREIVNWIHLAYVKDKWLTSATTVLKLSFA
jgi:hypothetical protein